MSRGKPNPDWKKFVLEWRASGKSPTIWCKENGIHTNTLSGWKKRLEKQEPKKIQIESKAKFIELKNRESSESGISLEWSGIKIHLKTQFDFSTLKQCLEVLRGVTC